MPQRKPFFIESKNLKRHIMPVALSCVCRLRDIRVTLFWRYQNSLGQMQMRDL
jgi:hypothetical protein